MSITTLDMEKYRPPGNVVCKHGVHRCGCDICSSDAWELLDKLYRQISETSGGIPPPEVTKMERALKKLLG
jgi:hypothetical protein